MSIIGIAIGALALAGVYSEKNTVSGIGKLSIDVYNNNTQFKLVSLLKSIEAALYKNKIDALMHLKKVYVELNSGTDGLYGAPNKTTIGLYQKVKSILNNAYNAKLKGNVSMLQIKHSIDRVLEQKKFSNLKEIGWHTGEKRNKHSGEIKNRFTIKRSKK